MYTHRSKLYFIIGFICLLFTSQLSIAQKLSASEKEIVSQLEDNFRATYPDNKPGAAVLVVKNGKTLLKKAYGLADYDEKTPSSVDDIYKIGSITKQFTAVAVLMLEEEGKLKVSDPLSKFLPEFPNAEKITVEHLLTHTSGVKSYTSIPAWFQVMHQSSTLEELINVFKNEPMEFAPGDAYKYSNSGYILLGAIVEKASGMKYEDFIEKKVFTKAGLKNSYYGKDDVTIKNAVNGYTFNGDKFVFARPISMTQPHAAGSLLSTVDDLYQWNKAIFGEKVISQKSLTKAFTNYKLNSGETIKYGYGWVPDTLMGVRTIGHGGAINGFRSNAIMAPEYNTFVVVLSNNETLTPDFVTEKALAIATGVYKEEKAIALSEKELEKYVGLYPVDASANRAIFLEGGKLYSQRTGNPAIELINVAKDEFLYKDSFTRTTFKVEGEKAVGMHFGTKGKTEYFAKSDKPLPAAKKVITLTETQLKKLEGKYELAPNFAIVVKLVDGKIQAQATGQQAFEIFPTSEYDFFLKVVDAQIVFQNGTDGKITGLVLHQGGQKMPGRKVEN